MPPGDARFGQAQPCACTAAQRYAELFAGEFANMALENFKALTPDERAALKAARSAAKAWTQGQRRSLIFYAALQDSRRAFPGHGELHVTGCGCGKTHLAVGLAKAAIEAGRTVKLTTETALLRDIKRSYGDAAAPDEAVILADLGRAWLLVLDDVGTAAVQRHPVVSGHPVCHRQPALHRRPAGGADQQPDPRPARRTPRPAHLVAAAGAGRVLPAGWAGSARAAEVSDGVGRDHAGSVCRGSGRGSGQGWQRSRRPRTGDDRATEHVPPSARHSTSYTVRSRTTCNPNCCKHIAAALWQIAEKTGKAGKHLDSELAVACYVKSTSRQLRIGRRNTYPAAREADICRAAFGVPDTAGIKTYVAPNAWHVWEFTWEQRPSPSLTLGGLS